MEFIRNNRFVRKLVPLFLVLSLAQLPLADARIKTPAKDITADTTNFNNNLTSSEDTVQKVADKVDDLILGMTQNLFETFNAPSGTDPVADSATDTLNLTVVSPLVLTGVSGTDSLDFSWSGTFLNAQISESSVTQHEGAIDHDALLNFLANEHIDWTQDQGATNIHSGNYTDTDTTLTQEQVEDFAGAMTNLNTEALITVTYQDVDGTIDYVVDPNLSNYTNDAGFLTSEVDGSITNELQDLFKTIDAPSGTDPVADSNTDTLQFLAGADISVTGDSVADSLTFAFTNASGYITGNETITLSGDASGSGTTAITVTIGADKVLASHLKAVNAEVDEDIVTYEATTGDFEFHTPSELITAGTNLAWVGATLNATDTDTQLTQEQVEDFAGALIANATGTHTGISVTYQDTTGDMDLIIDHDAATNFVANEHIDHTAVTLTAGTGLTGGGDLSANRTFDFDYSSALTGDHALATKEAIFGQSGMIIEGVTADSIELYLSFPDPSGTDKTITFPNATDTLVGKATTDVLTNKTINTASNTITVLEADISDLAHVSQEQIEDFVGGMVSGNTETLIAVTYQDVDGTLDFVVDESAIDHGSITGLADNDHPQYVLDSGDTMTGALVIDGTSDEAQFVIQGHSIQTNNLTAWRDSSGTILSVVNKDGKFGIGTASPSDPLSIDGSIGQGLHIGDGANNDFYFRPDGFGRLNITDDGANIIKLESGGMVVNEDGNDRDFRVEGVGAVYALFVQGSDGNVGIGDATPTNKLDVVGTISTTGRLQLASETAGSAVCISDDAADRLFHDTNCDGTKDVGEEFIDIAGGSNHTLDSATHSDVSSMTEATGDIITWGGMTWDPLAIGTEGQALVVSAGSPAWGIPALNLDDLADVSTITEATGDLITWGGVTWDQLSIGTEGQALIVSGGDLGYGIPTINFDELADVSTMTEATGDMAYWGGASWDQLTIGTEGQVLTVTTGVPSWETAGGVDNIGAGVRILQNTTAGASVNVVDFKGSDRITPTDGDNIYNTFSIEDDDGFESFARITVTANDVTTTTEDGTMKFEIMMGGALTEYMQMGASGVVFNAGGNVNQDHIIKGDTIDVLKVDAGLESVIVDGSFDIGTVQTFTDLDATPDVSAGAYFNTNTSAVTITDFDGAQIVDGQMISVISKGVTTFDCTASGLKCGTTDIVSVSGDSSWWQYDGTDWILISFVDQSDDLGVDSGGGGGGEWTDLGTHLHPADLSGDETVSIGGTSAIDSAQLTVTNAGLAAVLENTSSGTSNVVLNSYGNNKTGASGDEGFFDFYLDKTDSTPIITARLGWTLDTNTAGDQRGALEIYGGTNGTMFNMARLGYVTYGGTTGRKSIFNPNGGDHDFIYSTESKDYAVWFDGSGSGYLTFGDNSQVGGAWMSVNGWADQITLAVQGHSIQTNAYFDVSTSSGQSIFEVNPTADVIEGVDITIVDGRGGLEIVNLDNSASAHVEISLYPHASQTQADPLIIFYTQNLARARLFVDNDNGGNGDAGLDAFIISTGGSDYVYSQSTAGSVWFNDFGAADNDLTIETDTVKQAFFMDAGAEELTLGVPLKYAGIGKPKRRVFIPARSGRCRTTNGCTDPGAWVDSGSADVDYYPLLFDGDSSDNFWQTTWTIPENYDGGTFTVSVEWVPDPNDTAINAGGVAWFIQMMSITDNDPINTAFGTAIETNDDWLATGDFHRTPETAAITASGTPAGGDRLWIQLYRDISDTDDDLSNGVMGNNAGLLGIWITYSVDAESTED